jgi:hypothetical protein
MGTVQTIKEDRVFGIIDNVLEQVFGAKSTQLIYEHLERRYSLRRCDISEKIDVFADCLEDFLKEGAYPIENKILNDILSFCDLKSGVSFQIALPVESDSDSQIRILTPNA